jgi:hypothetical protein
VVHRPFAGQAGSFSAGGAVLIGFASGGTRSTSVYVLSVSLITSSNATSILQEVARIASFAGFVVGAGLALAGAV